jgi:hypothetical protein
LSAVISDCGIYRYRLERGAGRTLSVIMVNPSTADAENDDPTIRKVLGFAERLLCERIVVGNKFAFRATDVNELRTAKDPIRSRKNGSNRLASNGINLIANRTSNGYSGWAAGSSRSLR